MANRSKKVEQGDQTRRALIEAADELFASRGYHEVALEEIARKAGVTKGALYHHFSDKPALFEAALAERVRGLGKSASRRSRELVTRRRGRRRSFDRVEAAVAIFLDQLSESAVHRMVLVEGPAVLGRERFDEVWVRNSLVGVRGVLGPFDESPGVPPNVVDALSRILLGGVQEAAIAVAQAADPARARREFERALAWLLRALHEKAAREGSSP